MADAGKSSTSAQGAAGWDPLGIAAGQANALKSMQSWSDTLLRTFREQAAGQQALLSAVSASLESMERALVSQEETNRALRASLESYKGILNQALTAQEAQVRLIHGSLDALAQTVKGQLEAAQAMSGPAAASFKTMQEFTDQWLSTWRSLLTPPERKR